MCEKINFIDNDDDGTIISPVFDEISLETYSKIKDSGNFIFLDPQGFLRQKNSNDEISLKKDTLDLKNIDAIKMNPDELYALTGLTGTDGIKQLQKLGIEHVLYTNKQEISLLVKDKLYTIHLPKMTLTDTTGVGDIFCSTFVCTMLKEKDFLWALSFAGGAAQSALESKAFGLEKVPEKNALESNGSYFYNIVDFKQI
jgi:sugar/nucleoside kinase (ribokinase family)